MAGLPDWVQGALRPSIAPTWYRKGTSTPEDLSGATITGYIVPRHSAALPSAITGVLTVTDGPNGVFRWDLSAVDVAGAGDFYVQFIAAFGSGQTPAKTFVAEWTIERSL